MTAVVRRWAKDLGKPFTITDVLKVMREVNPSVTSGPFYHLVRRKEIRKLRRGLFVHPDHYAQFTAPEWDEEAPGITH